LSLSDAELREIVANLATRPGHEPVRRDVQTNLIGHLGASRSDVKLEQPLPEVHGRLDALLCHTVFEFKKDLRREKPEAERQLGDYLRELERRTGHHYVGVATDGAEFIPYELQRDKLVARTPYKVSRTDVRGLALWLSPFVATRPSERPDPEGVRKELGKESLVFEVADARLRELWNSVREHPEVALKRKLWADRLQLVYGTLIDDDTLFFQHTYLTIVAKTMATLVLGVEIPEPADLLVGKPFQDAGIDGVVESDSFDWVLATPDSDDLIRRIAAQVARFRLGDIEHDVLKGLYESLIDPQQRHDLGEYYTPDWLANRICARVIENPLAQRVLDPSCGSGTFLFHAVRRLLAAADAAGLSNRDAIQRCTGQVMGIDVHPVAVINARITYLLAIGENRLRDRPRVSIPVYLGDSMQWNTSAILSGQGATVFPRRLFVVVPSGVGRFGSDPDVPVVESRESAQEKKPWKFLPPITAPVEKAFLRPLYLGESVAPFRLLEAALAVIPWNKDSLLDARNARNRGFAHLAAWMTAAERMWGENRKETITLCEKLNFYGKLSAQMPPARLRVVYAKAGTLAAAAILRDRAGIVENKLYWAECDSEGEANFLIAVINSETLRSKIAPDQSRGQWGARDFDKLLINSIPEFDSKNDVHNALAKAAETATLVAKNVELPEAIHFTRARQRIRAALREDGITQKIDKSVEKLLAG